MIQLTDNLEINKPAPVDDRLGVFESTAEALAYIAEDRRYVGLTLIVDSGSGATEYWFENGVQDGDLTVKSTGGGGATWGTITGTLTNQTDLNTALNGKFNNPTGTTAQYLDGLGTPTDFPTAGQAGTLVRQVRNETGATLSKGTVVYISGASGNKALVSKAIATGDNTSAQTFGVVQADILTNQNGYVVVRGDLAGLNTSAYTEGAQLYLSSTTAGAYTSTKQYAPNHLVYIAIVTRSHVNQGSIEVAIQNGFELDELHNVQAQNPSNKNSIFFDSADSQWKARAVSATDIDANVSNTEFSYLDGVTSSIQTQINAKQDSLGFTPENVANKSTSVTTDQASNIKYPSVKAVFDWAVSTFTTTSSVASQITTALTGYATQAWVNSQGFITNVITALGFTPENVANKQTDLTASATKYPTVNAVNTGLATKEPTITSGTSSQFFKGDKTWATITASDVPSLDTSKITTGTFASARIPKITRPNVFDSTAALAGSTTSETVIKTITIPANSLSVGDVVKLGVLYSFASNTNTKTARIRFGSNTTSGTQIFSSASMLSTVTGLSIELWLIVTSSTNMRVVSSANTTTLGSVSGNINNLTIDITTATSFSVTITKTTASDTATCEMSYVEILTA